MGTLSDAMQTLVDEIRSSTDAQQAALQGLLEQSREKRSSEEKARMEAAGQFREGLRINLSEKHSDVHNFLERFSLERRDMASALQERFSSEERARREAVLEMAERTRQFREAAQQSLGNLRANLSEKRSEVHHLLGQFSLERRDMASAEEKARRGAVMEMAEGTRQFLGGVRASLGETASDIRWAHQTWMERLHNKQMAPEAMVEEAPMAEAPGVRVAEERVAQERLPEKEAATGVVEGREEDVLEIIARHAEGIRLVDIGNEMGVDWRTLIGVTKSLVDSGRVEKIENLYYPKKEASEER